MNTSDADAAMSIDTTGPAPEAAFDGAVLERDEWLQARKEHEERVDVLTERHQSRASSHIPHPVEDFLFSYYRLRPAQLRQWHPGARVALAEAPEFLGMKFYRRFTTCSAGSDRNVISVDVEKFVGERSDTYTLVRNLLSVTQAVPAQFGCFGLHEWAMVFRQDAGALRHASWPLRLGQEGTDEVVRSHQIRCSHFDAYRFFTPPARPLNLLLPTVDGRVGNEQPGCLHANMDLYKWSYKLLPLVPSALVLDCCLLTRRIREFDMRASPYDLADLGYPPVPIETTAGKAEYVAAQREFAAEAAVLRERILTHLRTVVPARS